MSLNKRTFAAVPTTVSTSGESPAETLRKATTAASLALSEADCDDLCHAAVEKALKSKVTKLATQVNEGGLRGYDAQGETAAEWLSEVGDALQTVLDIGIGQGRAIEQCFSVLWILGDSWRDLCSYLCEEEIMEMFGYASVCLFQPERQIVPWAPGSELGSPFNIFSGGVWMTLIHAGLEMKVDEKVLFRAIKNAVDNEIEFRDSEEGEGESFSDMNPWAIALDGLLARKAEWENLPSTIQTYKMRWY